jgi:hypothetical protein
MSNKSVIPSQKHCRKKLREIGDLKKQKELNYEQKEKISKEKFYKDIIRTVYQKVLERIPDEVQQIILEYLDVNTRLKMLRSKYTQEFAKDRMSGLLIDKPISQNTLIKLVSLVKYLIPIFKTYLSKDGDIYKRLGWSAKRTVENFLNFHKTRVLLDGNKMECYNACVELITTGIKHYSQMYKKETDSNEIRKNEINILKLFTSISML